MKELYSFDVERKIEEQVPYTRKTKNGPIESTKKIKKTIKNKVFLKKPTGSDIENAEFFYGQKYNEFINGSQIVAASRFVKGGSMKGCPLIKSILVRSASFTLYYFSSIPIRDASNGFRLFSRKLLNEVNIESKVGFAYSLELLAKCNRLKYKISEIPAQWEERSEGSSRFKVFKWLPQYLKWYIYGLSTTWLKRAKI